jgi:hypothetical protein
MKRRATNLQIRSFGTGYFSFRLPRLGRSRVSFFRHFAQIMRVDPKFLSEIMPTDPNFVAQILPSKSSIVQRKSILTAFCLPQRFRDEEHDPQRFASSYWTVVNVTSPDQAPRGFRATRSNSIGRLMRS